MSANRSVQAAQRRRAGPPEPSMPGRGPQPSINSAQIFANQSKSGQGPSMPTGRLAGQQAAMQQKQMQQMQQNSQSSQKSETPSGISKMTIAQAITLITLRLGAVETKIMSLENDNETDNQNQVSFDGQENMVLIDKNVIQSITSRLESLEKRSIVSSTTVGSSQEVALLKQQFETVKQAVIQTKGSTTTMGKDNKDLKIQVNNLMNELNETKGLLSALQNLTMENTTKIMELSSIDLQNMDGDIGFSEIQDIPEDSEVKEMVGNELRDMEFTNLKKIIESEINAEM